MKLSKFKTGDLFKVSDKRPQIETETYIVLSDEIRIIRDKSNKIIWMNIVGHKLFKSSWQSNTYYRIKPEDIFNDEFPLLETILEKFAEKELPLLIDLPNKTKWFERVLKDKIRGKGSKLHERMLDILYEERINEQAEIEEVMSMYENGQESG